MKTGRAQTEGHFPTHNTHLKTNSNSYSGQSGINEIGTIVLSPSPSSVLFLSVSSGTQYVSQDWAAGSGLGCGWWSEVICSKDSCSLDSAPVEKV